MLLFHRYLTTTPTEITEKQNLGKDTTSKTTDKNNPDEDAEAAWPESVKKNL